MWTAVFWLTLESSRNKTAGIVRSKEGIKNSQYCTEQRRYKKQPVLYGAKKVRKNSRYCAESGRCAGSWYCADGRTHSNGEGRTEKIGEWGIKNTEGSIMRIALINENSQAGKNQIIFNALEKVVVPMGHVVDNYGMYTAEDKAQLTYVQVGILGAVLLNSGAADYVITGCGTGEGAMLAMNSFPKVLCGHVEDPVDAYTFAHVNDGNAIALPFAKGFGWGAELNLEIGRAHV